MENLLQLAFDNLSSYNDVKIRKGLRQVEGLLAQLCLKAPSTPTETGNNGNSSPQKNKRPLSSSAKQQPDPKPLTELAGDPAFREFFRLQEGFEYNITQRLLNTLDRLVACGADGKNDLLILSALDITQGVLLLHPPSKSLFSEEKSMNLLLDLIEPINCPAIQCATVMLLVVALMDCPRNTRTFEKLDGLLAVTTIFRGSDTPRDVKFKMLEFLYFYLMPETPSLPRAPGRASPDAPALLQRSPSKLAKAFAGGGKGGGGEGSGAAARRARAESDAGVLSTERKQAMLSVHLTNVEELVKDLSISTSSLFHGVVA